MTTKLRVYNGALRECKETAIQSLTENRPPRHYLDGAWDDGFVNYVLEQGFWKFALRTFKLEPDASVTPAFGLRNAFSIPSDHVRTVELATDEFFVSPHTRYQVDGDYLYSDLDELYIRYVSNDASYGADLSRWTESFNLYVQTELALRIVGQLNQSDTQFDKLVKLMKLRLKEARSKDSMEGPTRFLPEGRWASARGTGGSSHNRDVGSRSRLYG